MNRGDEFRDPIEYMDIKAAILELQRIANGKGTNGVNSMYVEGAIFDLNAYVNEDGEPGFGTEAHSSSDWSFKKMIYPLSGLLPAKVQMYIAKRLGWYEVEGAVTASAIGQIIGGLGCGVQAAKGFDYTWTIPALYLLTSGAARIKIEMGRDFGDFLLEGLYHLGERVGDYIGMNKNFVKWNAKRIVDKHDRERQ